MDFLEMLPEQIERCKAEYPFELLETILLENGEYFLLERHLHRLQASAQFFRIPVKMDEIISTLEENGHLFGTATKRVRLLVDKQGDCRTEFHDYNPSENLKPVTVRLADRPVHDQEIFLYHKTTYRHIYEQRKKGNEAYFDVLLRNQRDEITEFTIGNIVVQIGDKKYTPPVRSGLLPGVFRQELVDKGELTEKVLVQEDLLRAGNIWLINSVRRWIPVTISDIGGNV